MQAAAASALPACNIVQVPQTSTAQHHTRTHLAMCMSRECSTKLTAYCCITHAAKPFRHGTPAPTCPTLVSLQQNIHACVTLPQAYTAAPNS
jgi:hypothetical protein